MAAAGKTILFVGTKKQAQKAIEDEAKRCGMYYINSRWLGGTLTNFKTIRSRIARLNELDHMEKVGEFNLLPKKEVIKLRAEMAKLEKNLGGIKDMDKLPDVMFVVDTKKEHLAVKEAKALNIPIVALIDTNCDPEPVDYVIPGNDDAIRAISLIAGAMATAVIEAREGTTAEVLEEVVENAEAAEATEAVAEVEEVKAEEVVEAPKKRTRKTAKAEEETVTEE